MFITIGKFHNVEDLPSQLYVMNFSLNGSVYYSFHSQWWIRLCRPGIDYRKAIIGETDADTFYKAVLERETDNNLDQKGFSLNY